MKPQFHFNYLTLENEKVEGLDKFIRQSYNLIIVRSFLKGSELDNFANYADQLFKENPGFPIFPKSFYNTNKPLENGSGVDDFFSRNAEFIQNNQPYADLKNKVLNFFQVSGLNLLNPKNSSLSELPASTFRLIKKDFAPIYSHCEKYLLNLFPFCKKYLIDNNINVTEHYSFFVMLKKPKIGGELVLLDSVFDGTTQKRAFQSDSIINEHGVATDLTEFDSCTVKLNPGDMLIFDGGNIWHAISKVESEDERITFGGFINSSLQGNDSFLIWS